MRQPTFSLNLDPPPAILELMQSLPGDLLASVAANLAVIRMQGFMRGPPALPELVARLLGPMSPRRAQLIAERILYHNLQDLIHATSFTKQGLTAAMERVKDPGPTILHELWREKRPVVIAGLHLGPTFGTGAALARLQIPALILVRNIFEHFDVTAERFGGKVPDLVHHDLKGNPALGLMKGVERLRAGGMVMVMLDGPIHERPFMVPFLGRRVPVGRGCSFLARRGGAVVVPLTVAWGRDMSIEVKIGEPIPPPDPAAGEDAEAQDLALTIRAMKWLEGRVRARPAQMSLLLLMMLARLPRIRSRRGGRRPDGSGRTRSRGTPVA